MTHEIFSLMRDSCHSFLIPPEELNKVVKADLVKSHAIFIARSSVALLEGVGLLNNRHVQHIKRDISSRGSSTGDPWLMI